MPIAVTKIKNLGEINPDGMIVKLTFSGNYTTGGDTLNLTAKNILSTGGDEVLGCSLNPVDVAVDNENLGGAYVELIPGTTPANWLVQCFSAGGTQVSAGAYPAAFTTGSPVTLCVTFSRYDR